MLEQQCQRLLARLHKTDATLRQLPAKDPGHVERRIGRWLGRYADDMVVMCRSREEAGNALEKVREWMAEAGLTT